MKEKKHFITLVCGFVSLYLAYLVLFFAVGNVYGDFFFDSGVFKKKVARYRYYSKTLYDRLKLEKANLIFGTSRSFSLNSQLMGGTTFNMHSIYGAPESVYSFLSQLSDKQIGNLNHVYYLVDINAATPDCVPNLLHYDSMFEFGHIKEYILSVPNAAFRALYNTIKVNTTDNMGYITEDGDFVDVRAPLSGEHVSDAFVDAYKAFSLKKFLIYDVSRMNTFLKIDNLCSAKGIKITYFTSTFPYDVTETIGFDNILAYYKKILEFLPSLYFLVVIPDVSSTPSCFIDESHLSTAGYKVVANILLHGDDRYLVKKDDSDRLADLLTAPH